MAKIDYTDLQRKHLESKITGIGKVRGSIARKIDDLEDVIYHYEKKSKSGSHNLFFSPSLTLEGAQELQQYFVRLDQDLEAVQIGLGEELSD